MRAIYNWWLKVCEEREVSWLRVAWRAPWMALFILLVWLAAGCLLAGFGKKCAVQFLDDAA